MTVILIERSTQSAIGIEYEPPKTIEVSFPSATYSRIVLTADAIEFYAFDGVTLIGKLDNSGNMWILGNYLSL